MPKRPHEAALLVENHPCNVMNLIAEARLSARVESVKLGESFTDHVVVFSDDPTREDLTRIRKASIRTLRLSDKKVWVRTEGCAACKALYSLPVIVESAKVVSERTLLYRVMVPDRATLDSLVDALNAKGVKVSVLETTEIEEDELTNRQLEILALAYKMGYFDDDRKVTLKDIADKLGISVPTLDEILRRALRKVMKAYLERVK
jgi:predicted DNA binding protein